MTKLACAINTLPKLAGSSFFVYNDTKVICTVSHMQDYHTSQVDIVFFDEVNEHKKEIEKYYSSILQEIYKMIAHENNTTRYEIALYLVVGTKNKLLCAVNAMMLALVNTGYQLKQMAYACTTNSDAAIDEQFCVVNASGDVLYAHKSDKQDNFDIIRDEMNFCLENSFCGDIF